MLLNQSFCVAQTLDIVTQSKKPKEGPDKLDCMSKSSLSGDSVNGYGLKYEPRAACLVKSTGRVKYAGVFEPVLTRLRTHVRAELGDQRFAKCREPTLAEHLPYLGIWKALKCGDLQLQKMILIWVEVNCMYASWTCLVEIVQYVITGRCYAKNDIITADVEEAVIDTRIFPGKRVNVLVVELGVLLEGVIVIDAPLVILVEH